MRERWRVAVLDSGLGFAPGRFRPTVVAGFPDPGASCRFIDDGSAVLCSDAVPDPIGHGTSVAEIICPQDGAAACELFVGQVLDHRGITTAAALAAAIHWSVRVGAQLIHMSLGLREDRQILAEAVGTAVDAGSIVVASAPARGEGTYPARYPGVIRATADARCQRDEISDLHSSQADFGGCSRHLHQTRLGGASLGAAHVTRFLVEHLVPGLGAAAVRAQLSVMARHTGIERHELTCRRERGDRGILIT